MIRRRATLSIVMSLVLLVQGLTLSIMPMAAHAVFAAEAPPAAGEKPCHGQAAVDEAPAPARCCDADCPDMASCLLAPAAVSASIPCPSAQPIHSVPAQADASAIVRAPPPRLRPPISLHR